MNKKKEKTIESKTKDIIHIYNNIGFGFENNKNF